MSETKAAFKELLQALKTDRDELRMQLHLGASDLKDELQSEWDATERHWYRLRDELREAGEKVGDALDDLGDDLEEFSAQARDQGDKVATEIRDGYQRIRDMLKR